MAAPGTDFLNQAVDEVIAALRAHPLFMSPNASGAPADASGVVMYVEGDLPETTKIPDYRLPHAGVVYLGHEPVRDDAIGAWDYLIEIGIMLYHRGSDRAAVWGKVQQAAAAVAQVVEDAMAGDRFDGFAVLAWDKGGNAIDVAEQSGYGAMMPTGIILQITRY